jgi:hypothetical protein
VAGGSTTEGARIYGWHCNGSANQYWDVADDANYEILVNGNSGLVLGVAGGSTAVGAAVVQWPFTGAANQFWY